jgi:hypothetical protein
VRRIDLSKGRPGSVLGVYDTYHISWLDEINSADN